MDSYQNSEFFKFSDFSIEKLEGPVRENILEKKIVSRY